MNDKIRIAHLQRENADLNAMLKAVNIDALIATQLRRSIERNSRLVTALQRIRSLDEKNLKYAHDIADEAIKGASNEQLS